MLKIGILGVGCIGGANLEAFKKLGFDTIPHDIILDTKIEDLLDSDIIFSCLPTPSNEDGSCNTSIIENEIYLLNQLEYKNPICIRSTVVPGFTQSLIDQYPDLEIAYSPEFLRERCALDDFVNNHNLLAIGCTNHSTFELIKRCHGYYPKNIEKMTPTEAELLKYFNNVYAALRITFANVFYELCDKLNSDYSHIKDSYIKTGKAMDMYLDVSEGLRGYAGMCLPKDTKALIARMQELNLEYDLIKSIDIDNDKFKKTVFEGMRK